VISSSAAGGSVGSAAGEGLGSSASVAVGRTTTVRTEGGDAAGEGAAAPVAVAVGAAHVRAAVPGAPAGVCLGCAVGPPELQPATSSAAIATAAARPTMLAPRTIPCPILATDPTVL